MGDIGNPVDKGGLNVKLGDAAVTAKTSSNMNEELWAYIVSLGADETAQKAGLVAKGFTADEADQFWLKANYLHALGSIYFGDGTQAVAFDYDSGLASVRGINV